MVSARSFPSPTLSVTCSRNSAIGEENGDPYTESLLSCSASFGVPVSCVDCSVAGAFTVSAARTGASTFGGTVLELVAGNDTGRAGKGLEIDLG